MLGSSVSFSANTVSFAGTVCKVKAIQKSQTPEEEIEFTPAKWGYKTEITYDCLGRAYLPAFYIGKTCSSIYAMDDGAIYKLSRKK